MKTDNSEQLFDAISKALQGVTIDEGKSVLAYMLATLCLKAAAGGMDQAKVAAHDLLGQALGAAAGNSGEGEG